MNRHRRVRDMTDLILVLWGGRWTIALSTLAAGVLAALVSLVLPRSYRAEASLIISESKLATAGSDAFFNPRLFNTFEGIIGRRQVLHEALEAFPALRELDLQPEDLAKAIEVNLINNSRLLTVSVVLPDPQLAADVANFLAQRAEEFTMGELYAGEAEVARQRLDPELAAAEARYRAAEQRLAQASIHGSVTALESMVSSLMNARAQIAAQRAPYAVQLGAQRVDQALEMPLGERIRQTRAALTSFRQEHSAEDLETRRRDLWDQRAMLQMDLARRTTDVARLEGELAAYEDSGGDPLAALEARRLTAERLGRQESHRAAAERLAAVEQSAEAVAREAEWAALEDQHLAVELSRLMNEQNRLYDRSTSTLEAMVAQYDAELAAIDASAEHLRALIGQVKTEVAAAEGQLAIAQRALESIQTAHSEAALRLEEKYQGLRVVDPAIAPHYAEFPRKKLLTLLAAGLALLVSAVVVVTRENLLAAVEEQTG